MIRPLRRGVWAITLLGCGLLAPLTTAGCASGGGTARSQTAAAAPATAGQATSAVDAASATTAAAGSAAAYRVTIRQDSGRIRAGADYTATIPVLSGPDPVVVRRVNTAIDEYVRQEKGLTENETLHLTAGAAHIGARVVALSFGGDRYPPGAAHPAELAAGLVFDLRTGDRVHIEDVFTSTGAGLRRLESIVRAELDRRFPGGPTGGVTDPLPANYQQFVVNPRGLVVIVADLPYVLGPQSVLAPWNRLGDLVRPDLAAVLRS
ncbi:conserved exported hypothetical protein [Frankia canadensis]|uniref:DUF3298 domain-containing protein n=1 Tax=Frankia canadensis TaxID=1836972 RepID=A0A2I2KK67_9ACTN|nr:RsiV family protein [Frankia canadensis]SNQ46046.1 conserved exported hypothetical protein [Frankia canadensis]SOU53336.1 conserved exported hypothetical protein [Frankia canadensis]